MSFFFANPWGLLALAAIPAIVAIHFLQEQSRRVRSSTLFLLEHARPTSEGGFRLERFQNSLPFWMQVLAACGLAWLLADPRWVHAQARQTVVVVLDSSASMQAFRRETLDAVATRLRGWQAAADRTDWHLLETGPRRPPLYAGRSLAELLQAAEAGWRPVLGTHPFTDAILTARSLVPAAAGGVILVTDRVADVPADVAVLSAATPCDNVGFAGGRVDVVAGKTTWRTLVTNHGDSPQAREITVRAAGGGGLDEGEVLAAPMRIELAPGQTRSLAAEWPADGRDRIVLSLTHDRLTLDDTLPLVRPVLRRVRVAQRLADKAGDLLGRMAAATDGVDLVADPAEADLVIDRLAAEPAIGAVLVAVNEAPAEGATGKTSFDTAWVAAEDHPLARDLGWAGLLSGPAGDLSLTAADTPLLWKGGRPLAFLRVRPQGEGPAAEWLVLNWDLSNSTAAKTAAVVVMMTRFVERIRERIPRSWAENFETAQAIRLPGGRQARAPEEPGFFAVPLVAAEGEPREAVTGAAQFADARECDLRTASEIDTLDTIRLERIVKRSVEDPWAAVWIAAAAAAVMMAWAWGGRS